MSRDQTEAESERGNDPAQPRRSGLAGLRAQPGFRTAVIAFVLTVVLGIGGTAAYAYWSKSPSVSITGTTRSDLPANTTLIGAQPALAARPGTPTGYACTLEKDYAAMRTQNYADLRFSWQASGPVTQYVVTVKSLDRKTYQYSQTQTVSANQAVFQFSRLVSDKDGNPVGTSSPFYTKYVVRVMPMNGSVAGDPLYFTYDYGHFNSTNCYYADPRDPAGASPLGSADPVVCDSLSGPGAGKYTDLGVKWAKADKATSYSVRMLSPGGYGGEVTVTDTKTSFRVMRPAPESDDAPYFATYTVRVQPMNGTVAGDPVYLQQYQFYTWKKSC